MSLYVCVHSFENETKTRCPLPSRGIGNCCQQRSGQHKPHHTNRNKHRQKYSAHWGKTSGWLHHPTVRLSPQLNLRVHSHRRSFTNPSKLLFKLASCSLSKSIALHPTQATFNGSLHPSWVHGQKGRLGIFDTHPRVGQVLG